MRISVLGIGAIASIIAINSVFADATVTSKQYVDTTRQATIPAANTNYEANGGGVSVVTYTDNAGVLGERGIYDGSTTYNSITDAGKLVTAGQVAELWNKQNDMPTISTSKMICLDEPDCTLWQVVEQTVSGTCKAYDSSSTDADECCSGVLNGTTKCGCNKDSDCPWGQKCTTSGHYCGVSSWK